MAKLVKCKDCGFNFSKRSKVCPQCGKPHRRTSGCAWIALILILGLVGITVIGNLLGFSPTSQTKSSSITSEEARKQELSVHFSAWDGSHRDLVKHVKTAMHDPKSFEHVETTYIDKGDHLVLQMKFRGKNQYNAIVTHAIYAEADMEGNILETELQK